MPDDVFHQHKLSDAVPQPESPAAAHSPAGPTPATQAEQQREAEEGRQAHNAQGDMRDRLVDIGKANHMAGRGNGRVSDA